MSYKTRLKYLFYAVNILKKYHFSCLKLPKNQAVYQHKINTLMSGQRA